MTASHLLTGLAIATTSAIALGLGTTYMQIRERDQLAAEIAQWRFDEWKQNLLEERRREFLERSAK